MIGIDTTGISPQPFMFVQVKARDAEGNIISDESIPVIAEDLNVAESFSRRLTFPDNAVDFKVRFFIERVEGPGRAAVINPRLRVVDEASDGNFDELNARITEETTARVAGDTALANRTNTLEVQRRVNADGLNTAIFGAFDSLEEMEAVGYAFYPPLSSGRWLLNASQFGAGLKVLILRARLATDPPDSFIAFSGPGNTMAQIPDDNATYTIGVTAALRGAAVPDVRTFAGWTCIDINNNVLSPTDAGAAAWQGGFANLVQNGAEVRLRGYGRGRAAVGAGNNVGVPAPLITAPNPFPLGTVAIMPAVFYENLAPGAQIEILAFESGRVTRDADTRAVIKTESTARAAADEALAQQIQTIIAQGAQGTKTFFQPTAPPNPEPGWLWFRDNAPPLADELFRWSGAAWVQIDTSESVDTSALSARITDESTARVAGDTALGQRTTVVEASSQSLRNDVNSTTFVANQANARVTDESIARVAGDNALATRTSNVEVVVGGVSSRVTVTETTIAGQGSRWSVRADNNGRVAGLDLINGTVGPSLFSFLVDVLRIFNPISGVDEPIFEARDGAVFIRRAFINDLTASNIRIDGNTISSDGNGALTLTRGGVTTPFLAPNAVAQIYAYSQTTGGTSLVRNVWQTITLNGLQAAVAITNDPAGPAFIRFDVSVLIRNFGSNSDRASFRVYRSDGVILPTQYTGVYIDDTPNDQYGIKSMLFFDIGVPAGVTYAYYLQANSNEESIIRTANIVATLTKNSQAAPFAAPFLEDF